MITVTFYKSGDLITGYTVKGHSGYAEQGSDILCAFVSSAVIMTANTITEVQKKSAEVTDSDGFVSLRMSLDDAADCQYILEGLQFHLAQFEEQYSKYIKLKFSEV